MSTIPANILETLCKQYIYSVPIFHRLELNKLCFIVEKAHWRYIDDYKKNMTFERFARLLFEHVACLAIHVKNLPRIVKDYNSYKSLMPRSGALLFSKHFKKVLLVKHAWPNSWGFPQGKIMENEDALDCAIREVHEETGFDIKTVVNKNLFVEGVYRGRNTRLYVVENIPLSYVFQCVDNEIKSYQWFCLKELFSFDESAIHENLLTSHAYNMIAEIKLYLNKHRRMRTMH